MLRIGICSAMVLCVILLSSAPAAAELGKTEREILDVMAGQVRAWNDGDIEGYMGGYLHSDSLRFASGGTVTRGWEATLERYAKRYTSRKKMGVLTFSDLDVTLLSKDAAVVFGKWKLEREDDEPWGLFTVLFRRTGDGWRIVHDHSSSAKE